MLGKWVSNSGVLTLILQSNGKKNHDNQRPAPALATAATGEIDIDFARRAERRISPPDPAPGCGKCW